MEPLKHNGKTFAEMKPLERARLAQREPQLYEQMHAAHDDAVDLQKSEPWRGKTFAEMKPAQRARLANTNEELYEQMSNAPDERCPQ